MKTTGKLGHAVLRVRDLGKSVPFYRDVFGMREVAKLGGQMAFLSFGENHHDLGLQQVGKGAAGPDPRGVGLYHLAFRVGDSLEDLRAFRDHLHKVGVRLQGMSDHRVSQSLYFRDPDGIELEAYVDADPKVWKDDPGAVAVIEPLDL